MFRMLDMLCYGLILLFGVTVSLLFSGAEKNRKCLLGTLIIFLFTLSAQILCRQLSSLEHTRELYPLIVHLPLILFFAVFLKCTWLTALSSVFSAYLCCQIPRWFASVWEAVFQTRSVFFIIYIPAMMITFFFLKKYIATPASRIMNQSKKSCLLFGAVPLFYYVFDYVSTIYTNWLYSGSRIAVQFIPSIVSIFYFVFVLIYYTEMQKERRAQQERDLMAAQLKEAKKEFHTLRQMQDQTRQYRHDMRHHFLLLKSLAAQGELPKIIDYLQNAEDDLNTLTPTRYCENETFNLLLSHFETVAGQMGVAFSAKACVPQILPLSDTQICSLISNSLENAVTAAGMIGIPEKRTVSVHITIHKEKLLLSVENPYTGTIVFQDGFPKPLREGHGYGTRNIAAIAELYGGQALFSADNGIFSLKVMIPLKQ